MLAELSNPELEAALVLAKRSSGRRAPRATASMPGPRQEQVDTRQRADRTWRKANLLLRASSNFAATRSSPRTGFASRQDLDKATAAVERALANLSPRKGGIPSRPSRADARGAGDCRCQGRQRRGSGCRHCGAGCEIEAFARRRLGLSTLLVAEPAEAIVPGQPVMTLQAAGRPGPASICARTSCTISASARVSSWCRPTGRLRIDSRIAEIVPRGEFATWRAARAVGDYDLNTFLIRADPIGAADAIQPGMTVWLDRQ